MKFLEYCNFKEGFNCYAVSNEQELINNSSNIDPAAIIHNAKLLVGISLPIFLTKLKVVFTYIAIVFLCNFY